MIKNKSKLFSKLVVLGILAFMAIISTQAYLEYRKFIEQNKILRQMVERLEADSRIAEVLVTDVQFNPVTQKHMTTIKFLEYGTKGEPLEPKYFTFAGNIIQFQSLVARFEDIHVAAGDALRGRSVYLFWKVFVLNGQNTQEYEIAKVDAVPEGYKVEGGGSVLEKEIWHAFWNYALDPKKAGQKGIKNAQIEAPGTKFVPGILYTIRIEHDGGIRIDPQPIPAVLKGETIR